MPRVKSIELILDALGTVKDEVTSVARPAFYHLQLVKQLVPHLTCQDLATIIQAMVQTGLLLLYKWLSLNLIEKLQVF